MEDIGRKVWLEYHDYLIENGENALGYSKWLERKVVSLLEGKILLEIREEYYTEIIDTLQAEIESIKEIWKNVN